MKISDSGEVRENSKTVLLFYSPRIDLINEYKLNDR